MKTVNSRLKVLVAEKSLRDRRQLGIRTVAKEAGVSVSTVQRLMNNTMRRVPLDDLGSLCTYFNCDVGDILRADETQPAAGVR